MLEMLLSEAEGKHRVKPLCGSHSACLEPLKSGAEACAPPSLCSSIPVAAFQSGQWKGREEGSQAYPRLGQLFRTDMSSSVKLSLAVTGN